MRISSLLILLSLCSVILLALAAPYFLNDMASATTPLSITAKTTKSSYYLREEINLYGNFTQNGSPVENALVAIEIIGPLDIPLAYRTIPIGSPSGIWSVNITNISVPSNAKIYTSVMLSATIRNNLMNQVSAVIGLAIYDENLIPFYAVRQPITLEPREVSTPSWSVFIPEWVRPGKATVYISVYDNYPRNGGVAVAPETSTHFYITRNTQLGNPYAPPKNTYITFPGNYSTFIKIPPDRYTRPGSYSVFVTGLISVTQRTSGNTMFSVLSDPCPPEASFTYTPIKVYQNMTVTFDASSSSAEGYNDTIVRYEWKIYDPPENPVHIIKQGTFTNPPSPTVSHTFQSSGTYLVWLNVTDNEGLWATASKQIAVLPEFGPTANFTWYPYAPIINETIKFDASGSTPGWSALTQSFSPIVSYVWNFSDGAGNITVTTPVTNRTYTEPGNYTVELTVVDAVGRFDTTSATVEVLNLTIKEYDIFPDGIIDMKDVYIVARAFMSEPGDPNWNPVADITKDGKVDMKDIYPLAKNFMKDP